MLEEAEKRDHRKIGREMGLFQMNEEAPGFPFFLPNGMKPVSYTHLDVYKRQILYSLLCVFTLMPCLLMIFGKYIDKTHHKSLLPDISGLGNIVHKLRMIVPPIFVVVLIAAY